MKRISLAVLKVLGRIALEGLVIGICLMLGWIIAFFIGNAQDAIWDDYMFAHPGVPRRQTSWPLTRSIHS